MSLPPAGDDAGDRQRGRSAARRNRGPEARPVGLEVDRGRRAAGGVQSAKRAVPAVVDQPEPVAAHAVHVRVDDRDRGPGGDRGIDRVATAPASAASACGAATSPPLARHSAQRVATVMRAMIADARAIGAASSALQGVAGWGPAGPRRSYSRMALMALVSAVWRPLVTEI